MNVPTNKKVALALSLVFSAALSYAADINVLVIGSEKSSSDYPILEAKAAPFSAAGVTEQLRKILSGAGLGTTNVVLEDHGCNLISWFYWPLPADVETKTRWPNLRGENGIQWDYVVLIEDPYTIEYLPGLYAQGVAKIAAEVAKGKAKTVLLMPWPAAGSQSSVAHYKEVVYRAGRSGGLMVAPAALAWEAAGKPQGETHPSKEGAYLAAASIYSLIWNKNAKTSSYQFNEKLADTAFKTVTDNGPAGTQPYTSPFMFQQPFRFYGHTARTANPGKSPGGSSTEQYLTEATKKAILRAGATVGGRGFRIGRDSGGPEVKKDYRLGDTKFEKSTFAYRYQHNDGNPDVHLAQIFSQDIDLADQVRKESNNFRVIPRRLLYAGLYQLNPAIKPMGGQGHLSSEAHTVCGTYIYTIISGRCPVDPKPNPVTNEWLSQMEGYQTAWRLATGHVRTPGFKVVPAGVAADSTKGDPVTVQFLFPPQQPVTVNVSCPKDVATATPQLLTFTPQNYNQPQQVIIKSIEGAKPAAEFEVRFQTTSQDEVYDNLSDSWTYQVNNVTSTSPKN